MAQINKRYNHKYNAYFCLLSFNIPMISTLKGNDKSMINEKVK